jgi:CHASE3 domain sensor protein
VQVVVGALVALLALCGFVALAASAVVERTHRDVAVLWLPALVDVERLQKAYLDQQSGVRGYAITGQRAFLEPYETAAPIVEDLHAELDRVLAGQDAATAAFAEVRQAYQSWHAVAVVRVLEDLARGHQNAAIVFISSGRGQLMFDVVGDRVDVLRSVVQGLVDAAGRSFDTSRRTALAVILTTVLIALALAVATAMGLRRSVSRPLAELVTGISAVAAGALDRPVRVAGPPEIANIAAAAEQMRVGLMRHTADAVAAEQRMASAREGERIAANLARQVIERLAAAGMSLSSLANRHPEVSSPLLEHVRDLDTTIVELRGAVFDLTESVRGRDESLSDRVAVLIGDLERVVGSGPEIRVDGPVDRSVPPGLADVVLTVLAEVLPAVAGSGAVTVRLAVSQGRFHLELTHRADRPDLEPSLAERAEQLGGGLTAHDEQDGARVLDWSVPCATDRPAMAPTG